MVESTRSSTSCGIQKTHTIVGGGVYPHTRSNKHEPDLSSKCRGGLYALPRTFRLIEEGSQQAQVKHSHDQARQAGGD
jgi:hypothetical protein